MEDIFKLVQNDPDVQISEHDIESWMKNIDDSQYNYLEGKTSKIIEQEKRDALCIYKNIDNEKMLGSLSMYRTVNDLRDLRMGRHCRWINNNTGKLHKGGYLTKVDFREKGVYLLCELLKRYKMQVKMEDNAVFQKITAEEWIVIMANEYEINSKDAS
jgi:hypothetical protein